MTNTVTFCFTSEKARELYNGKPPQYETPFASGFDLRAFIPEDKFMVDLHKYQDAGVCCIDEECDFFTDDDTLEDWFMQFKSPKIKRGRVMYDFQDYWKQPLLIYPQGRILIKTGIRIAMPIVENEIMELQIRSRSGLALKHGICVLNGIGTIDNDYTGELGVILYNAGHEPFKINIGDRIAQGIFNPLQQCIWQEVSEKDFEANYCNTKRGSGGFGSTGK